MDNVNHNLKLLATAMNKLGYSLEKHNYDVAVYEKSVRIRAAFEDFFFIEVDCLGGFRMDGSKLTLNFICSAIVAVKHLCNLHAEIENNSNHIDREFMLSLDDQIVPTLFTTPRSEFTSLKVFFSSFSSFAVNPDYSIMLDGVVIQEGLRWEEVVGFFIRGKHI